MSEKDDPMSAPDEDEASGDAAKADRRYTPVGGRLPGDPGKQDLIARMVRVDHAGEYGAVRIYEGQLAVLRGRKSEPAIRGMLEQEKRHLDKFDEIVNERNVRPTALSPLWHAAGFALGAATALMGEKAAMACTVAIEDVIEEHYRNQADKLGDDEKELRETIEQFRAEELEHHDEAIREGAEETPGYRPLTGAIRRASRLAIWLSERI